MSEETEVEIDMMLRYHGDICEKMAEALWPAVEDLDADGDTRTSTRLAEDVKVDGTLTLSTREGGDSGD